MDFEKFILSENPAKLTDEYVLQTFVTKCEKDEDFIQLFQLRVLFSVSTFVTEMVSFVKAKDAKGLASFSFNLAKKYEAAKISCYVYAYFISATLRALHVGSDEIRWVDPRKNDFKDITYSGNPATFGMGGFQEKLDDFEIINGKLISVKSDNKIVTIPHNAVTEILAPSDNRGGVERTYGVLRTQNNVQLVTVPCSVKSMSKDVFKDSSSVQTVILPPNITVIPDGAFQNTPALGRVLAKNVTEIGKGAFENSGISSMGGFDQKVLEKVQSAAFRNCKQIKKIDLPNTYFSVSSLAGTSSLKLLSFKAHSRISMMKLLFMKEQTDTNPACSVEGLKISFPDGKIPEAYFDKMTSLKQIYIEGKISEIGDSAFAGLENLEALHLEYDGQVIPKECFKGCKNLKTLPSFKAVSKIYDAAFEGMESLTNIELAPELSFIGKGAFKNCKNLQQFPFKYVGDELPEGAFDGMDNFDITAVLGQIKVFGPNSVSNQVLPENFKISPDVKKICTGAFAGSKFPENFVLSLSPNTIYEEECFKDTNISAISYNILKINGPNGEIEPYRLFASSKEEFKQKYNITRISVNIPDIPDETFMNWENLLTVGLGDKVKTIGKNAFAGCKKLCAVASKAKDVFINIGAFEGCKALNAVYPFGKQDPNEILDLSFVNVVGSKAFEGCKLIKEIDAIACKEVYPLAFLGCENVTKINVTVSKNYVEHGFKFFNFFDSSLESFNSKLINLKEVKVTFPNKAIPESFFEGLANVTSIEIEGEILSLGKKAFRECPELANFSIDYKGDVFPSYCFENSPKVEISSFLSDASIYESYSLSNLTFPKSFKLSPNLKKVEAHAFENSKFAENFVLELNDQAILEPLSFKGTNVHNIRFSTFKIKDGNGKQFAPYQLFADSYEDFDQNYQITRIIVSSNDMQPGAFKGWNNLVQVIIDSNVTNIPESAFEDCDALKGVKFKGTNVSLGDRAFYNCKELTTIKGDSGDEGEENVINLNFFKKLGSSAFYNCSSLSKVIADEVADIDRLVFNGCESIKEVNIKVSKRYMNAGYKFYEFFTEDLETFNSKYAELDIVRVILEGDEIKESFFEGLNEIVSLTVQGKINKLGARAFKGMNNLEELLFIYEGEVIEEKTFADLEKLSEIPDMNNVRYVKDDAFRNCSMVKEIVLSDKLIEIGKGAFKGCSNLTRLESEIFADEIKEETFRNCTHLSYIDLTNIAKVGQDAFKGVEDFENIATGAIDQPISEIFPDSHIKNASFVGKRIPPRFYSGLEELESVSWQDIIAVGAYAFSNCKKLYQIGELDKAKYVGDYAFENTLITECKIPGDVEYLGDGIFAGCRTLMKISVPLIDRPLVSLFSNEEFEGGKEVQYLRGDVDEEYFLPSSLVGVEVNEYLNGGNFSNLELDIIFKDKIYNIPPYFLKNYKGKIEIDLSEVISIAPLAFAGSEIDKLELPKVEEIQKDALRDMTNLKQLIIGEKLHDLDEDIFLQNDLTHVELIENEYYSCNDGIFLNKQSGEILFVNKDAYGDIKIPVEAKRIAKDAFKNCNLITELHTSNIERIDDGAFEGLEDLTLLEIQNEDCVVGEHILNGSDKLEAIVVPSLEIDDAPVSLNYYLSKCKISGEISVGILKGKLTSGFLANYNNLNLLDIGGCDLEVLPSHIFRDIHAKKLVLPNNVKEIEERAFENTDVKEVVANNMITKDGALYFNNKLVYIFNKDIEEFTLLEGTTSIYPNALEGLNKLESVTIKDNGCLLNRAFNKYKLKTLTIGEMDFTQEFENSFESLEKLTYLGETVKENSLTKFTNVKEVYLTNLKEINKNDLAFKHDLDLIQIDNAGYIYDNAFGSHDPIDSHVHVKSLKLLGDLQEIGENALYNAEIDKLDIKENKEYKLSRGLLIDKNDAILFAEKDSIQEVEYLGHISYIHSYAFHNCHKLTKVRFKDVERIGDGAFYNCKKLEKVIIGGSLKELGNRVFENDPIAILQIPFIGKNIDMPAPLNYLFDNLKQSKYLPIKYLYLSKQKDISSYPFRDSAFDVVLLSDELEEIKDASFQNAKLDHLVIPKGVKKITGRPFKGLEPATKKEKFKVYIATDIAKDSGFEKMGIFASALIFISNDEWEKVYKNDLRIGGFYENE